MNQRIPWLIVLLTVSLLLVSGCVEEDPSQIVKSLPEVQEFLAEHPNAKIVAVKLSADDVTAIIGSIREDCGQQMQVKEYWYVTVSEEGKEVEVYLDAATNEAVCIIRETITPPPKCEDDDGVCPANCDAGNDSDCFAQGKETLREGETLGSLRGTSDYIGSELSIKLAAVTQASVGSGYLARIEVYSEQGELIDVQTVSAPSNLNEQFLSEGGEYVLRDNVKLTKIAVGPNSGKGYVEIEVIQKEDNLLAEGETLAGLKGTGEYTGQNNLYIELQAVTQATVGGGYTARFAVYDGQGNLLDVQSIGQGTDLGETFIKDGEYVLFDQVKVNKIGVGAVSGVGYTEIEVIEKEPIEECKDNDGKCPATCDQGNDNDCFAGGKETLREGETLTGLRGTANYIGLDNLYIKLAAVTQASAGSGYQARFEIYDAQNNLIDSQTVSAPTNLNEDFVDGAGEYILRDNVKVTKIAIGPNSGKGYVEIEVTEKEDNLLAEGETKDGLRGTGEYAGQNDLYIELQAVTQTSAYQARFAVYDGQGTLLDVQTVSQGVDLGETFIKDGEYVLQDKVEVVKISEGMISGIGYAKIEITEKEPEPECKDNDGSCPASCDPGNDKDCFAAGKETIREEETLEGLRGAYNYIRLDNLFVKLASVTQVGSTYQARFEVYDKFQNSAGNLIDSQTVSAPTNLSETFIDDHGEYVLRDKVEVTKIAVGPSSGKGYAEMKITEQDDDFWVEGEQRTFRGTGDYAGQNMIIKFSGGSPGTASFGLYDEQGYIVDYMSGYEGTNLNRGYLQDDIIITKLFISQITSAMYIEIEVHEREEYTLEEGDQITGLNGRDQYEGQSDLYIKMPAITIIGSGHEYEGRFELYSGQNVLIDSQTVGVGTNLSESFLDGEGNYVLKDTVKVTDFDLNMMSGTGSFDVEVVKNN